MKYLWLLNAGHGSLQAGKRSPLLDEAKLEPGLADTIKEECDELRFFEYWWNRRVLQQTVEQIESHNSAATDPSTKIHYREVVPEVAVGSFLNERTQRGNAWAREEKSQHGRDSLWFSIHSNTGPLPPNKNELTTWCDPSMRGIEVFHHPNSKMGKTLGTVWYDLVTKEFPNMRQRNVKQSSGYFELRKTAMPSIITEFGFYNNQEEVYHLLKADTIHRLACINLDTILKHEHITEGVTV